MKRKTIQNLSKTAKICFGNGKLLLLLITVLCYGMAHAQIKNNRLSGKVVNTFGEPLVGATISIKGSSGATLSDSSGNFTISGVGNNSVLTINYVGYTPYEAPVSSITGFVFSLSPGNNSLNDVVIVGYTTQKRSAVTGSVSVVDINSMQRTKSPDVIQSLQGQVSGVMIQGSTGQPGDAIQIVIRGPGTIGNIDPLYIIDGVPTKNITFLDGSDIQSISVLKDAAATAIYGSLAANGVILLTTKRGKTEKPTISLSADAGFQTYTNRPDMLSPEGYLKMKKERYELDNPSSVFNINTNLNLYELDAYKQGKTIDWFDEVTRVAPFKNTTLAVSGATSRMNYYVSGNYMDQQGIVVGDQFHKFSVLAKLETRITDWLRTGFNLGFTSKNADGVAALISMAKAFKNAKPAPGRSIVFLAVTAEEQGLLGSEYYATHPIYPLNKTIADLNMDALGDYGETKDFAITGKGQNDLDDHVLKYANAEDRIVVGDRNPGSGSYYRSDHFNFAKVGVPALDMG